MADRSAVRGFAFLCALALAAALSACHSSSGSGPNGDAGLCGAGKAVCPDVDDTGKVILFGDFHAHTTISFDAAGWNLPVAGGTGFHLPMEACEFARHCAALDFWSINDHAEFTFLDDWQGTKEAIRACNAAYGGDTDDPEMVSYLGWEWTQIDTDETKSYGHRNVILHDTAESQVPTRPIGAGVRVNVTGDGFRPEQLAILLLPFADPGNAEYNGFFINKALRVLQAAECPEGVPVRDLPLDCQEGTRTPEGLFAKLDDWGYDSIVIPHSGSWGFHNPPLHGWSHQINSTHHDRDRELLLELYSGHGNSEVWRSWRGIERLEDGTPVCPEATPEYEPCCNRAREAARTRDPACQADPDSTECADAVAHAERVWMDAAFDGRYFFDKLYPGEPITTEELGDCGQCRDCGFNAAFSYGPLGSAQAALAQANFDETDAWGPMRYRFGFIGSTDEHRGRPGTGYKDDKRFSDTFGPRDESVADLLEPALDATAGDWERQGSFWFAGGKVVVHSTDRSRESIWEALKRKEAYATSGKHMLLWFDAVSPELAEPARMGSTIEVATSPTFRVKAMGDWIQAPGCPQEVVDRVGQDFVDQVCLGECYNPTGERRPIERIEVVRIRPQIAPDENLSDLIDDPWRVFPCDPTPEGCEVTFTDPDYAASGRPALYYVRALQPATPVLNAEGLRCSRYEGSTCVDPKPCVAGYQGEGDDCLAPASERAWSSPIYLERG